MYDLSKSCIILDKPEGISSNNSLKIVKKKLNQKKAGFSGILDPMASGVLIIFFNKATKACSYFTDAYKTYKGIIQLGVSTDSGDSYGKVISKDKKLLVNINKVKEIENHFHGEIEQTPPMYSALKYKGKRLYKYAREGTEVIRNSRKIIIKSLNAKLIKEDQIEISVECSKGTYIRTLAESIGRFIGCESHLSFLRRTKVGNVDLSHSISLNKIDDLSKQDIIKNYCFSVDNILDQIESCYLSEDNAKKLVCGRKIKIENDASKLVKIYDNEEEFLGIAKINEENELIPIKIFV